MPFSLKTSRAKINVRFFNLIVTLCLFVISLQKGVFKGQLITFCDTECIDKGGKAMKL